MIVVGCGDGGSAISAELAVPSDVAVSADGSTLYIADAGNSTIREVTPAGVISTVAGNGRFNLSGDGGPATNAGLFTPRGVFLASDGSLYIADTNNNRIREVDPNGTISTIAGTGPGKP